MNATLGYAFVLGGLAFAAFGTVVGFVGGLRHSQTGYTWVLRSVIGFFVCMFMANAVMVYALVTHDFSVSYVAQVGSRATPLLFTVVSLWSALEGSILFWGLILGSYLLAFGLAHRREPPVAMQLAVGTMLAVGVFFAFLIAGPANPFHAVLPVPPDGPGPNPLLQNHLLMVIHPPMLYLGYVGMTVPFGVAVAALIRGELSPTFMAPLRRWTLIAWAFLSVGVILGAWWAYAVLGWGGYWAWDPVENASFLPWLTSTAFVHSTMVQERKGMLKVWTVALALASFILTLLGTFMTRSGVFNSVHSFTQSDIGPTFLVFIGILLVASIGLLSSRAHLLAPERPLDAPISRETAILVNNLMLVAITFTVLLGTLFPLISEALRDKRISVGEPYFNRMSVPGFLAVLFLMGVGPALPWGRPTAATIKKQLMLPALIGVGVVVVTLLLGFRGGYAVASFGLAGFALTVTLRELLLPAKVRMTEHGERPWTAVVRSAQRARRRFGGYLVHLAVILIAVAVSASSSYVSKTTVTLKDGESARFGRYDLTMRGFTEGQEPHRSYLAAKLDVKLPNGEVEQMLPRMNFYERSTDPIGTPAVRETAREDLYISLMAFSQAENTASFNVWVFPLVSWIWWSIPLILLGSAIAAWPTRKKAAATVTAVAGPPVSPQASRGAA
ncbi:MAG: heme lyase CcmF/NrfE family subunit [Myxococcota bacterium]|nr:heme lyase CcmF/NrfE family subunit [Myxococcota bacterium]